MSSRTHHLFGDVATDANEKANPERLTFSVLAAPPRESNSVDLAGDGGSPPLAVSARGRFSQRQVGIVWRHVAEYQLGLKKQIAV